MGKILKKYKHELILAILICIYIIYFTTASFLRYDNFYTGRFDLGNMDQTVWNTINGRIFQTSNDDGTIISRLSSHADFMLILLSPFYLLWSHPKMLLLIQSIILGLGGIFVFLIAKNILKNKNFALIFSSLYLMYPPMQFTNLYDFHAVTLATTFLLASFYFLIKQKYFLMVIFLILSGITKEQVWVITSFFGFPLLFQKIKKIKFLGLGITFFSLAIFGYLVWYAIPQSLGSKHFALSYYSDFGDTPTQIVRNILFSPQELISTVFEGDRLNYLNQLFMPLGFISLVVPPILIFTFPDLLINLLSSNSQLHQIYYQYSATITPFIFVSAIFAVLQLNKWFPKISKFYITLYLVMATLLASYLYGPLPISKKPNIDMFAKPLKNKELVEKFILTIPKHYTVAATNNLGSHLSQRRIIYTIPIGVNKADIVLFLLSSPSWPSSLDSQKQTVENMKLNKNYIEIFSKGDFVAFKKRGYLL